MNAKIIALILAAALLTACYDTNTTNPKVTDPTQSEGIVTEAPLNTEDSQASDSDAPIQAEDEASSEPIPAPQRTPVPEDEKYNIDEAAVRKFIDAVMSGDSETVSDYCVCSENVVDRWIGSAGIQSYEILGLFKENIPIEDGHEYTLYYALVKITAVNSDNAIFKDGENLYKFYGQDEMSPIDHICLDGESRYDQSEYSFTAELCESYKVNVGVDFAEGEADSLFDIKNASAGLREFAYFNHRDINSMDELTEALTDNIAVTDAKWKMSELKHELEGYAEYHILPRGGCWLYYDVSEYSSDKIVIDYYADIYGFQKAVTVEYGYKMNSKGYPCITYVDTVDDTGAAPVVGAI